MTLRNSVIPPSAFGKCVFQDHAAQPVEALIMGYATRWGSCFTLEVERRGEKCVLRKQHEDDAFRCFDEMKEFITKEYPLPCAKEEFVMILSLAQLQETERLIKLVMEGVP